MLVTQFEAIDIFYYAYTTLGLKPYQVALHLFGKRLLPEIETLMIRKFREVQKAEDVSNL